MAQWMSNYIPVFDSDLMIYPCPISDAGLVSLLY